VGSIPGKTLTRDGLKHAVRRAAPHLSGKQAAELIEETLREVERALLVDGEMSFHGFGNLVMRSKRERMGRNPKTKTSAVITAKRVVSFKGSPCLLSRMNGTVFEME
jgi:integration host factor subunit alpha